MPTGTIRLIPGVNVERTPTLLEAGYSQTSLGRFRDKLFQKLGGWTKFYPFSTSGIPRDMHAWDDLNANSWLSVGSTSALSVISDGTLQSITPQQLVSDFSPDFTTTSTSKTVTVTDPNINTLSTDDSVFFDTPISVGGVILHGVYPVVNVSGTTTYDILSATAATSSVANGGAVPVFDTTLDSAVVIVTLNDHGLSVGNNFTFPISTTGGGVTISGTYRVIAVPTANEFEIGVNVQASSTATFSMNGGDAEVTYYINLGPPAAGSGYGLGGYGDGGYGTGVTPTVQTGTPITSTDWTSDNWGEILVACPANGGVYYWQPRSGQQTAFFIPTAPVFNGGIFVSMPQQILVAWGSTAAAPNASGFSSSPEQRDPLIVRWSDILDFTNWAETSTTQAGSFHIPTGSRIVGGAQGTQEGLIWTDIDLWIMSYLGAPLVFGFNKIGAGAGLISAHGYGQLRGGMYWMGPSNFYRYAGGQVEVIPCPVWDVVFQNLDTDNQDKCRCCPNTPFNEVMWEYPSASGGTGENDSYVKFNIVEGTWDYGPLQRSAWIDQSVLGPPIGAAPNGLIYQHETSNDADGAPINAVMQTGYFMLSEGNEIVFVDWMWPDFKYGTYAGSPTANIQITLSVVDYPNDTPRTYGPYTINSTTQYITPRARGRMMAVNVQSNDVGSFWRLGAIKYRFAPDGRL